MRQFLFLCTALISLLHEGGKAQEKRFSFTREKMASPFTIILYTDDSANAGKHADNGFKLVDSFVNIFSDYIQQSELNQLSANAGSGKFVPVSPALFEIIKESRKAYLLSEGAFDITMGPIIKLWRKARKDNQLPAATAIAEKMKIVGFRKIIMDTANKSIQLLKRGMQLDLGGIAQGYIAQKVLERLRANGITKALIDVSGDIAAGDSPPGKEGWVVGINLPESEKLQNEHLLLRNGSVSTSGDVYQFIEHRGRKYSHIIDPSTGYGITSQRNVTVIADNATTADWLATACSVMPIKQATKLAGSLKAEVLIAEMKNGVISRHSTKSFAKYYRTNKRNL